MKRLKFIAHRVSRRFPWTRYMLQTTTDRTKFSDTLLHRGTENVSRGLRFILGLTIARIANMTTALCSPRKI